MTDISGLTRKLFQVQLRALLPAVPPAAYVLGLLAGVNGDQILKVSLVVVPVLVLFFGALLPYITIQQSLHWALTVRPTDRPGSMLKRILRLPRLIELRIVPVYATAVSIYMGTFSVLYDKGILRIFAGIGVFLALALLFFVRQAVGMEKVLRPLAVAELEKHPAIQPRGQGLTWTRQSWYLPYTTAMGVLCVTVCCGTVIVCQTQLTMEELLAGAALAPEVAAVVRDTIATLATRLAGPLLLILTFVVGSAIASAMAIARQQREGAEAIQRSIQALASGKPQLPQWATPDELGDLAFATAGTFDQLHRLSTSLRDSAALLGVSADALGTSNKHQNEALTKQSAAIQETQVTAQEIRQTSMLASQKAEKVLQLAERAEQLSRSGEAAIEQSLGGLGDIRTQVQEMAARIRRVEEQARQIATITSTVKELADQSNMLALNAAIEAVRSGEHGKGFAVVAREIRTLADQSIEATDNVREILQDIEGAISTAVTMSDAGSAKVTASVEQVRASGENIRQLSSIVRESASSVRQISSAVTQQNAGIGQIFQAVNDLTQLMEDTLQRLRGADDATQQVNQVAEKVSTLMGIFKWQDDMVAEAAPAKKAMAS